MSARILLLLDSKLAFVQGMLDAGKLPSAQQIAAFLQALVQELKPHIKDSPPPTADALKVGFAGMGWDVATNSPAAGSAPPQPSDLIRFLEAALVAAMPDLMSARTAAVQANKALQEELSELSHMEEEALDSGLSSKQEKQLEACRAKISTLRAAASDAAKVVAVLEARCSDDQRAAADEAAAATREMEALRVAQATKDAAAAAAGGGGGGGRGRGGGGKGGGGKGGSGKGGSGKGGGEGGRGKGGGGGKGDGSSESSPEAAAKQPSAEDAIALLRTTDITLVDASDLRVRGYVLLPVSGSDQPCRIQELTTSKTGKHGHAKLAITATDVASGRKVERNLRADEKVTVPGKRWIMAVTPVG
eukprot:3040037-Prymnesium_polylepis.1